MNWLKMYTVLVFPPEQAPDVIFPVSKFPYRVFFRVKRGSFFEMTVKGWKNTEGNGYFQKTGRLTAPVLTVRL